MARNKRIREAGLLRHVMSRGNGRMQIFLDENDYIKFLFILGDVLDKWDVDCWDACVMSNHYHLTLMNRRPNLSEAIQHLNGEYATWWNARHERVGHVFQGRFKDQIVQCEGYLRNLLRYVALNPVRAGLVTSPEQWRWSAYRHTAGFAPKPAFLSSDLVLAQFGDAEPAVLRERYIRHVLSASLDAEEQFKRFRSRQRVLGDRLFKSMVLGERPHAASMATSVSNPVPVGFP